MKAAAAALKIKIACLLRLKSDHLEPSGIWFVISSSVARPTCLDSRLNRWRWAYTVRVEAMSARGIAGAPATVPVTPLMSGAKASLPPVSAMSPHPHDSTLVVRSQLLVLLTLTLLWLSQTCTVGLLHGNGNSLDQRWQSAESLKQIDTVICRATHDM